MPRRKPGNRVPPVSSFSSRNRGATGSAWDRTFLGGNGTDMPSNVRSPLDLNATEQRAIRLTDEHVYDEIELAINGDDQYLLPYQPTPTINPGRPRTLAAGYDERSQTLRIKFRDGDYYTYYNIPPSVWWKFRRANSPGRYINTTLNNYPYKRGLI